MNATARNTITGWAGDPTDAVRLAAVAEICLSKVARTDLAPLKAEQREMIIVSVKAAYGHAGRILAMKDQVPQ